MVLGITIATLYKVNTLANSFKENMLLEVVLKDEIDSIQAIPVQKSIKSKEYVKTITFISKEQAAVLLQQDLGENFLDILGYNPLYNSFTVNLYESYINEPSLEKIRKELTAIEGVQQVNFQQSVLQHLDSGVKRASIIGLAIAGLLLVFAISLIFSTIRLAMFSRRFTIKSMQLFGATRWFIIKPFLGRSIWNGFLSGMLAGLLLTALMVYVNYAIPELGLEGDLTTFALLLVSLLVFGIVISFLSTLIAVTRYLSVNVENLY